MDKADSTPIDPKDNYNVINIHVWRILIPKTSSTLSLKGYADAYSALPALVRFMREIFAVAPWMFGITIAIKIWSAIEDTLLLSLSNQLLKSVCKFFLRLTVFPLTLS